MTTEDAKKEKVGDEFRTPDRLYQLLDHEARFVMDLAARSTNTKSTLFYGPGSPYGEDSLAVSWVDALLQQNGAAFMNHPYSKSTAFIGKAAETMMTISEQRLYSVAGIAIYGLIPYMPSERWWSFVELATEVRRIPHRVKFLLPDGKTQDTARFASCVAIWRPTPGIVRARHAQPRYSTWDYR